MKCWNWCVLFTISISIFAVAAVHADNDIQGQPAPESADELITEFGRGFAGEPAEPTRFEDILQSSQLKLKLRNYYFSRAKPNNPTDPLAWAQGGSLEYKVDKVGGIFGLGLEYFTSFKLYGPDDQDGTLLLEPGQNNIDTLGVANPRANIEGNIVSLYRQKYDLPYVNQQDNRMVPITFEGYTVAMPKTENEKFQYVLGYISEIKKRDNENFVSMSEAVGVTDRERGMITSGLRYFFIPELSLAAVNYYVSDTLNVFYTEANHKVKIDDKMANAFSVQYSDQRTVGDDLFTVGGDDYSTGFWGVQNAFSYNHLTAKAIYTYNDTGATIRAPWGTYPGYNSGIVEDFNRAGEKAWQLNLGYNFARLDLKGLSLTTGYIHGIDAIDEVTKAHVPDKHETDVTIDYRVQDGTLKGFWLRMRAGLVREEGRGTTEDYRIIVNYEIPLYEPEKETGV